MRRYSTSPDVSCIDVARPRAGSRNRSLPCEGRPVYFSSFPFGVVAGWTMRGPKQSVRGYFRLQSQQ
jgi:hypothetical protein